MFVVVLRKTCCVWPQVAASLCQHVISVGTSRTQGRDASKIRLQSQKIIMLLKRTLPAKQRLYFRSLMMTAYFRNHLVPVKPKKAVQCT